MWVPDRRQVSAKETVGRRVFEESPFFERNARQYVKISIFYETRPDEEGMSFDRLGIRTRDFANTIGFLTPLATSEAANRRPPRPFTGWLGIRAMEIKNLGLRPDPITEEPKNPYHVLLPLEKFREAVHADNLAHRLARASEEVGLIPPANGNEGNAGAPMAIVDVVWSRIMAEVCSAVAAAGRRVRDLIR
jgi:hypothetical protein